MVIFYILVRLPGLCPAAVRRTGQTGTVQNAPALLHWGKQRVRLVCSKGFRAAVHLHKPLSFALSFQFKRTQNSCHDCWMSPAFIWNHAKHQGSLISVKIKSRLAQKGLDLTFIEAMKFQSLFQRQAGAALRVLGASGALGAGDRYSGFSTEAVRKGRSGSCPLFPDKRHVPLHLSSPGRRWHAAATA